MKMNLTNKITIISFIILIMLSVFGCSCSGNRSGNTNNEDLTYNDLKLQYHKPLMDWNKEVVGIEKDVIIKYAERRNWDITESGTGLYYDIYFETDGRKATPGDYAEFEYTVYLMDGTMLYTSDSTGTRKILLGHNNEESGIDEALQMMSIGEKAHLILPPHLAFGVPGDGYLVPPRTILVYDIELISLNNN
jgi:FKBP-type peptidyl-prolyl cis-trans isomerase